VQLPNPRKWFLDRYVAYLTARVNRDAEKVRKLQAESGMARERVVRYEVSEGDMARRNVEQTVYKFTFRVGRDGSFVRLPDETRPDVTVYTDVPAVWGIANDSYTLVLPDGTKRVYSPFTVFDAMRLGKVDWTGTSSALSEFMLFERKVAPEFLEALKLPGTR
jgi:hypothetical protein